MTRYPVLHPVGTARRLARFALGVAAGAADALIRGVTAAVVERLDLDDLVSRVDVNRVADRIDVDRIAVRVDVDRVADRVDVNRVADRVDVDRAAGRVSVDLVIGRVDLDLVADRIDVDRVASRLDLGAVLARLDLAGLTKDVLEEIDLGRIVRDTGGGVAAETVDGFRARSMRADRTVNRFTDRLLHRSDGSPP
ncbi:hypothetical protein [Streptomyces apricus]|uniref:Uncharacterized protein n=1 Tax=Streptomyces apricus TaxID=1828112 RepID=A0A5B0BJ60_9ACTN|nr:hypothetical protein [Streptomyces apricus]KAA0940695.1 hypothetical protein FGF04_07315 [Streptomyces apricus]